MIVFKGEESEARSERELQGGFKHFVFMTVFSIILEKHMLKKKDTL